MGAQALKIAVAVSGGADSLASLLALGEAGHEVLALHGVFLPEDDGRAVAGLMLSCARLGVPLHCVDLSQEFERRVVAPFVREYLEGHTPNPCARCNAGVKFGLLLDRALGYGAEGMATGHYAAVGEHPVYGWALSRGADGSKDCFVPGDDYRAFLANRAADFPGAALPGGGPAVLPNGQQVGTHNGLWRYTIGQRRGLGIAHAEPLYVLDKDMARNTLLVAPGEALLVESCIAGEVNILVDPALWPLSLIHISELTRR